MIKISASGIVATPVNKALVYECWLSSAIVDIPVTNVQVDHDATRGLTPPLIVEVR